MSVNCSANEAKSNALLEVVAVKRENSVYFSLRLTNCVVALMYDFVGGLSAIRLRDQILAPLKQFNSSSTRLIQKEKSFHGYEVKSIH